MDWPFFESGKVHSQFQGYDDMIWSNMEPGQTVHVHIGGPVLHYIIAIS